ncbi:bifunctional diguanylate cyclase/phosphodiesterase [Synechococcus sp. CS-1328]|uniref:putative bifunctional diguanylate cyclase/phosphodiesterase n=1 Tax=Synechococcus sp. CS-1328 TaxID=2847976 RepID=UPI00223A8107|nr:GGDEF and EAL domain-containing protein [Synechococcus sp. CS-1328]MCT0224490.1 EAL domain-containing protein [Synechococcus sp. CS-1328]
MTMRPDPPEIRDWAVAYSRLQQELITLRCRLDHQIAQLTRLNRLSDSLLASGPSRRAIDIVAEAIADVLDLGIGAVWVAPSEASDHVWDFALCGSLPSDPPLQESSDSIERLAAYLASLGSAQAVILPNQMGGILPGLDLCDALACRSIGRQGRCHAVLLAANRRSVAANFEPISTDATEVLSLIAEKFAAHLDRECDHLRIEAQVQALHASESRLELVLQGTNDGWWDWDIANDSCFLSVRWLNMLGHQALEARHTAGLWLERIHAQDRPAFELQLERALAGEIDSVESELRLRHEDGSFLTVLSRGIVARDQERRPTHFAGSILDLSERKRHEAHVHRLAFYDPLTELPNRRLLVDRLQQLAIAFPRVDRIHGVLMLDLDRFKILNDTHGHAAGDQLLCLIGRQLRRLMRDSHTVSRQGGDEFMVVLENLGATPQAAKREAFRIAGEILEALHQPKVIDIGVVHSSGSIGIALMTTNDLSVDTLLQRADVALYEAKKLGRNLVKLFEPAMLQRIETRSRLESKLRQGFEDDELRVNYQAQVDDKGQLCGLEALMRWDPKGSSLISPAEFIPIAEESGVIHALRRWSMETVCHQIARWGLERLPDLRVAVNISPTEFLHPDFPGDLISLLHDTGIPGRLLNLEITEATVLTDLDFAAKRMRELSEHDLAFSLDDFGTGFSSITYLRRLPVQEVKIDRSYVERFSFDPQDAAIVRAIVALCDTLGLRVIAEGIETEQEWTLLKEAGCRHFQGYLFGRPQPATQDLELLLEPRFRHSIAGST